MSEQGKFKARAGESSDDEDRAANGGKGSKTTSKTQAESDSMDSDLADESSDHRSTARGRKASAKAPAKTAAKKSQSKKKQPLVSALSPVTCLTGQRRRRLTVTPSGSSLTKMTTTRKILMSRSRN